jgi:hypothetical protein
MAYAGTDNVRVTRPKAGDVSKLIRKQSPVPDGGLDANDGRILRVRLVNR